MPSYDYDLGIIGGGSAGLTVAAGAAQLGARTLLVEKEQHLGGDCLHYGCVPSKTLIRTARAYHTMKNARAYGLPAPELVPVDFSLVRERIRSVIADIQHHDSVERFCGLGAKVEFGQPIFVDEHAVRLNGSIVSSKNWVIASGSSPAIPPLPGLDRTPYLTNREIFYLDHLPASVVILGAGPVAIEMAQAFCRLGTRVSVVQRSGQILSKEDKDLADAVQHALASEGVAFYLNTAVTSIRDLGHQRELQLRDEAGRETPLVTDQILVALGREANIGGLGLEGIGIAVDRKGLQLDQRLRTAQKHIYGAGDVTGAFQFTHAAGYEGGIVIANAIFHLPRKADYTWMPWCTYTDPELAGIGLNEKGAREAGLEYTVFTEPFSRNDRSLAEGEQTGKIKLLLDRHEKPLGVQILGPRAGELLNEWVAVLNGKVRLSTLASAVHPYPTLGEINKRVAGAYLSPKIFSERVRKGLKFFFNLRGRACG
ncbi:MAG: FAD-dependent oxidoreductase [Desulfobacterota bacterium]|nr:FAD-dependent oxidoreductase [Thermodesulfobacteriota bacterium]